MENADKIRLSEKLVTLDSKVPVKEAIDGFAVREPAADELLPFLKKMEFAQLTRRAAAALGVENPDAIAPAAETTPAKKPAPSPQKSDAPPAKNAPGAVMDMGVLKKSINYDAYETVTDMKALERWIGLIKEAGEVCVDTETTSLDAMQAALCGISLSTAPNIACYIPVGHRKGDGFDLGDGKAIKQLSEKDVLAKLKPLLEDEAVLKIGQNIKYDYLVFLQRGIRLAPIDDTMLISFVLDTVLHGHGMDALSELHLGHKPIAFSDVCGKGKDKTTFDLVALKEATRYSAEDADVTLRLHRLLKPRLVAEHLTTPYETLERPLIPILADMERAGITIAPNVLAKLSNDFGKEMARLETEIHKLAGGSFNLGSPKQLGEILFDRMKLSGGSRTKTGAWSTDADVLENLAAEGHELPKKILEWRQLAKLRSTYTDALPTFINPQTGRVHTSYAMAAASTGRLASTDPNLQNIPIRTEEGRHIRQTFIAAKGMKLISADYSQIELRLLAHMADIPALKKAFADGLDIHAMTASEIFGVPVKGMAPDVRRRAKAINFGIIYGISAFGLANQLGIARGEADAYIKKYFERFPGIRDYMEATKEFAREHGYVETLFGRRVHIREIESTNPSMRGGAERAAINAPLQGTAADIIRRAMIRLPAAFAEKKLKSRMLLQVHDELVIEAPDAEVEKASAVAKSIMEKSSLPAVELSVPLTVEARAGNNWDEAH